MLQARPGTGYQSSAPQLVPSQPQSPSLEAITFNHIQETSIKRISTLDYLRKAQGGRVYWFNTLLLSKPDLQRTSNTDPRRQARRATNYLLLGLSLPNIIDLYSSSLMEYLKTFNALLSEFESFQQSHPPDGSSSLSRGRLPQMFKRATTTGSNKRRTSASSDIGHQLSSEVDVKSNISNGVSLSVNPAMSFPTSENDLLPGEEYTYLLTPSLPFDPDMNETFATLCDALIECYTKLLSLVSSQRETTPAVAELFTKVDAKIKKLILHGVVKEFEETSRSGMKSEITCVGKVVLGGLM